jgi:2-iminoacetate synthase ThiH
LPVLTAHRSGDLETVRTTLASWGAADLLALGAVADAVRSEGVGQGVRIHEHAGEADVTWVDASLYASELEFLRAVAVARIAGRKGARIGVDWSKCGMELAQVALGFGASELCGPITRKSGLPIYADEKTKVKGQGMVELRSIKRQEIGALVTHAGRLPMFVDDVPRARESSQEVAGV